MQKTNKTLNILIIIGATAIIAFNPLSVVILADLLTIIIEQTKIVLVEFSAYIVAVGATILAMSLLMKHLIKDAKSTSKESKRLESLKNKPTQKAGSFL